MIKFRYYHKTLEASLKDTKEYASMKALIQDLKASRIEYIGHDDRCKQELFRVFARFSIPSGDDRLITEGAIGVVYFDD